MLNRFLAAVGIVAIALSFIGVASAATISAQCASMHDKAGCTCAVQNGGYVSGSRWFKSREPKALAKFMACMGGCDGACRRKCAKYGAQAGMSTSECVYVWARINKRYGAGSDEIGRNWTRSACRWKCEATYRDHGYASPKACEAKIPCSQFPDL